MTTVAASLECIAADQRMTSGNAPARIRKLRRVKDSVYGCAGDVDAAFIFFEWLETVKPDRLRLYRQIPEDYRSAFEVLEISPSGLALWNGWGIRIPLLDKFYAIGSGSQSAMQALKRGMSPEEAVAETFTLDECSGGTVETEYLLPPELRRKRRG